MAFDPYMFTEDDIPEHTTFVVKTGDLRIFAGGGGTLQAREHDPIVRQLQDIAASRHYSYVKTVSDAVRIGVRLFLATHDQGVLDSLISDDVRLLALNEKQLDLVKSATQTSTDLEMLVSHVERERTPESVVALQLYLPQASHLINGNPYAQSLQSRIAELQHKYATNRS